MKKLAVLTMALALLFGPMLVEAQAITSQISTVSLTYAAAEVLTVSGVPPSLTFSNALTPQTGVLTVTTSWQLGPTRTRIDTNLFFATPTAALSDGAGHNIPATDVFASLNGGTYSNCGGSPAPTLSGVDVAGGTCQVSGIFQPITGANLTGTRSDAFVLQLQNLPLTLPAATYTGNLSVVAGAN
jgi:hypothetical protein